MAPKAFVDPDSVLARTALGMLEAHGGGAGPSEGMTECPVCGEPLPCPVGRAAAEVVEAAGLAEASGLVAAVREGTPGAYASPLAFGPPVEPVAAAVEELPPWAGPSAGVPVLGGGEQVEVSFSVAPPFSEPLPPLNGPYPPSELDGPYPPSVLDGPPPWADLDEPASFGQPASSDGGPSVAGPSVGGPSVGGPEFLRELVPPAADFEPPGPRLSGLTAAALDGDSFAEPPPEAVPSLHAEPRIFPMEMPEPVPPPALDARVEPPLPSQQPWIPPAAPAVARQQYPSDSDPLLSGPPQYRPLDRPLDAPLYTSANRPATPPAPRPVTPMAARPSSPAPANGSMMGQTPALQQPPTQPPVPPAAFTSQTGAPAQPGQQPMPLRPMAQQPVASQPIAQQPIAQQPIAQQPIAQQPISQQPMGQAPMTPPLGGQPPMGQMPTGQQPPMGQQAAAQRPPMSQPPTTPGVPQGDAPSGLGLPQPDAPSGLGARPAAAPQPQPPAVPITPAASAPAPQLQSAPDQNFGNRFGGDGGEVPSGLGRRPNRAPHEPPSTGQTGPQPTGPQSTGPQSTGPQSTGGPGSQQQPPNQPPQPAGRGTRRNRPPLEPPQMGQLNRPIGESGQGPNN